MASASSLNLGGAAGKVPTASKAKMAHGSSDKEKNMVFREPEPVSVEATWGASKNEEDWLSQEAPVTRDKDPNKIRADQEKAQKRKNIRQAYQNASEANPVVKQQLGRNAEFLMKSFSPGTLLRGIFPPALAQNLERNFGFFLKPFTLLFSDPTEVRQAIPGLAAEDRRSALKKKSKQAGQKKRSQRYAEQGGSIGR
eukprot:CAMPEP_0182883966 /NCGR_PEP_ID=MMETSP0034_2-20130328/18699_1 /TAXON_ID=156128 /ORGANISM="Nephroselmis pyriformis, Strain CCMP717" /LENGTH=196 /DNA_ID=CAMNT_0025017129 /DNA_START=318 /DNA_END=908 /DNA_ORIENTATION=+